MATRRVLWGVVCGGATLSSSVGCNTIKSTVVEKGLDCGWTTKKYEGMPITVRVPSSVRLAIQETRYFNTTGTKYLAKNLTWVGTAVPAPPAGSPCEPLRTRKVAYKVIETPEVFYVDIPRPAAGSLAYGATIDPASQYFTQVTSDIDDKTVRDVTSAIGTIVDAIPKPTALAKPTNAGESDEAGDKLIEIDSEIAYKVIDVRLPDLTEQMQAFVRQYITDCNVPCDTVGTKDVCPKPVTLPPPTPAAPAAAPAPKVNRPSPLTRS